jgi:DNA repair exonuclease SbcCD ATPase subunit
MNENDLLKQLEEAEKELQYAQKDLAEAKSRWTDAETKLIGAKIHRDRVKESLRVYRATTPKYESNRRDEDIEQFRKDHPELVEWAKERDLNRQWCPECGGVDHHSEGCSEPVSFKNLLAEDEL